jgi:hypothetical protein
LQAAKIQQKIRNEEIQIQVCPLWQYGLWSFQAGATKLERFLHKYQLLNFEFWINGELSKIGHHFSNKVI